MTEHPHPSTLVEPDPRHRRVIAVRGTSERTLRDADALVVNLTDVARLSGATATSTSRAWLGSELDAVLLDLHGGLSADVLGQVQGSIRAGGALVLRMPPLGTLLPSPELALLPFTPRDVGVRFWQRLEAQLARYASASPLAPLEPAPRTTQGTLEQARVVQTLRTALLAEARTVVSLVADRGRGKSAALGLALASAASERPLCAVVSAPSERAAAEVFRFAQRGAAGAGPELELRFAPPLSLLGGGTQPDVIVMDEAAQVSVALLRRIVLANPRSKLLLATTTHGYEGTGRGYVLRFCRWLEQQERHFTSLRMHAPIRWQAGDPLERFVSELVGADVEITTRPAELGTLRPAIDPAPATRRLTADELAHDEDLLRSAFGLLSHAHYRTSPSDLQRILDAPNLHVHGVVSGRRVLAVSLVAAEGGLGHEVARALGEGATRIRGHALADTLACHAARPDAAELRLLRSVRIATHPDYRGLGLARALVEHVHGVHTADVFGTIFGASPELLEFRRRVGYELVRVGNSRGMATGEPPAVMLRAQSSAGARLIDELRLELAHNLPLQLRLLEVDTGLALEPELARALLAGLPEPVPLSDAAARERVARYLCGPQPIEAAICAARRFAQLHEGELRALPDAPRSLIEQRVLALHPWKQVAAAAGYPSAAAAMRAMRGALRQLASRVEHLPS